MGQQLAHVRILVSRARCVGVFCVQPSQEDDPSISVQSWTPWAGAAVGLVAFVAAVAGCMAAFPNSQMTGKQSRQAWPKRHSFESDCLGYLLAHSSSALTGVLAALLAFLEARGDDAMDGSMALSEPSWWWNVWAKPADEVLSATSFATFLLLCTLGLTRAMLGLALWPYAQRLRRPAVAKTLLQSAGTPRASSSTPPALTEQEPSTSPKPRRARKPLLSGRALEPSPDEAIAAVEDDMQPSPTAMEGASEGSSDSLCAGVVQSLLEAADWPASHCLTPHRVRSGAPVIHWRLVPRDGAIGALDQDEERHADSNLRSLACGSTDLWRVPDHCPSGDALRHHAQLSDDIGQLGNPEDATGANPRLRGASSSRISHIPDLEPLAPVREEAEAEAEFSGGPEEKETALAELAEVDLEEVHEAAGQSTAAARCMGKDDSQ
ncbi:unnamed protein product, partial [Symbiodinium sp. KB8]